MSSSSGATRNRTRILLAVFMIALMVGLALSVLAPVRDPVALTPGPTPSASATATTVVTTSTPDSAPTPTPSATITSSPTQPAASPTETATLTATALPTAAAPSASTQVAPTQTPTRFQAPATPRPSLFIIGGVNFSSASQPLTIRYPTDWDQSNWLTLDGVDILLSDATGANLHLFNDIGSWAPDHKIFVYADRLTGVPILSIHDGYWARRPLEAEPLRELIEGGVRSPFALSVIEANLERLRGHPLVFGQGGTEARFVVRNALRMDAETTNAYLYKPGQVSELFPEGEVTRDTLIVLICSTRQPDEPDETFPARFLILLAYSPG